VERCLRGAGPTDEHGEQGVIVDDDHEPRNGLFVAKARIVSHDPGDSGRVGPVAQQLQDRVCDLGQDRGPIPPRPWPRKPSVLGQESEVPLRSNGSLSMNRALMAAGLSTGSR
jgi:hypothetical protein